jgi:phosphate transport system substrate-binding protein
MLKNLLMLITSSFFIVITTFSGLCFAADAVRINGSGSALDMLKPMVEAYRKSNRDVNIVIEKPLGSSGAVKALLAGVLDVAVISKPLKPEEVAKGAQLEEYGHTPLVIITEKNIRKTDITTKELEEIYAGTNSTWANGTKIRLVLRPNSDIDTSIMRGLSPGMNNAITKVQSHHGMIVAVTDPEAYTAVANTPGGLGASALISIITEKLTLNTLSLNGVRPTTKNLASGAYPLFKEIKFVTTPKTTPAALQFVNFVYSPQGGSIAEKIGVLVTAKIKVLK